MSYTNIHSAQNYFEIISLYGKYADLHVPQIPLENGNTQFVINPFLILIKTYVVHHHVTRTKSEISMNSQRSKKNIREAEIQISIIVMQGV